MVTKKINPQRFSKATLAAYVLKRIKNIEAEHGFTNETGSYQCHGKPGEVFLAYGEREALQNIFEHFELVKENVQW
jgi:esterase/lipase